MKVSEGCQSVIHKEAQYSTGSQLVTAFKIIFQMMNETGGLKNYTGINESFKIQRHESNLEKKHERMAVNSINIFSRLCPA